MIRRRVFMASIMAACSRPSLAQQQVMRVAVLTTLLQSDPETRQRVLAFESRLNALGWAKGSNLQIDYRFAEGDVSRMPALAAALLQAAPDVVVVQSNPGVKAVLELTRAVPVVFLVVADPVGSGFVQSLAQPGGNATGFSNFDATIGSKWLEVLHQIAPTLRRVGIIMHAETTANVAMLRVIEAAAPTVGVAISQAGVHDGPGIERAIDNLAKEKDAGLIVLPHPVTSAHRNLLADLAARHRLPAVYPFRYHATAGGLISYGIDAVDLFPRAASYVDRLLRGAKPGDLPVQAPTKFELVINMKAAKALGLEVPHSLLLRADEVIE